MNKTGLLLLNLGTPDAPTTSDVRVYLREFLSDPRVIDIPWLFRMLLLYLVILPFRPKKSAAAYREIWMDEGSPLLVHGRRLEKAVAALMDDTWRVQFGMRYGRPGYAVALQTLKDEGVQEVVVLPLYPQWASSSTGSSIDAVEAWMESNGRPFKLHWVDSFCVAPGFIDAQVERCRELGEPQPDVHWLFSYHGLPTRQVVAVHPQACMSGDHCCDVVGPQNHRCYRAHCFATTRAIAQKLGLSDEQWSISFQSRLGRTPWLLPATEEVLGEMPSAGKTRLRVVCPSFVADCLETLEEIDIRGEALFRNAGGESFSRAICVNDHPIFVQGVADLANNAR